MVGLHQFTEIDKKILPPDYDRIPVLTDSTTTLPQFNVFNSATEIVQTTIQNIKQHNPLDVAVVLEPGSAYRPLIEAALKTNDIPYMATTDFSEDEDLRTFLNLLHAGLSRRGLTIKDVRPILAHLGLHVSPEYNAWQLDHLNQPQINQLKNLLDIIPGSTFKEVLEEYEGLTGRKQDRIWEVLDDLDTTHEQVTHYTANSLEYYLDSFDITLDRAPHGVMLASPKSSTYIDRPIVFYLGMDTSWTPTTPTYPWADKESFDEKNKRNFQVLLQNGEKQYYLVQDTIKGQKVTPCFYFNELTDQEIESFTDLPHKFHGTTNLERREAFQKQEIDVDSEPVEVLSQSSLNVLAYCPKDYFFSRVVDGEDNHYMVRGQVLHDFAEFYVNHPEFIDTNDHREFVELMLKRIAPYLDDLNHEITYTEFTMGVENIKSYLQANACRPHDHDGYERKYNTNLFSKHYDKPLELPVTEMYFKNTELGAKGKVDLIRRPDHIVDHKTGSKKSINQIMRASQVGEIESRPDFQAKMYLAHHRTIYPDQKLQFTFYHLLDNVKDAVLDQANYEDNAVDIHYYPHTFNNFIQEREVYDSLIQDVSESNSRRKTLEAMGYNEYRSFFQDRNLPDCDKDQLLESDLAYEFISYAKDIIGDYKYVKDGCESALKKLADFRRENYFKDDLDEFEAFLQEQIQLLNEYKREGFPVGEIDRDELQHPDLVIVW